MIEFIKYLIITWFVRTEKSDLDLLTDEERLSVLWWDIYLQNIFQIAILMMIFVAIAWFISRIVLNLAERKKILAEKNLVDKQAIQMRQDTAPAFEPEEI